VKKGGGGVGGREWLYKTARGGGGGQAGLDIYSTMGAREVL